MAETVSMTTPPPARTTLRQVIAAPVVHLQVLLVLAVLFGGGGLAYGLRNLVIQLFALLLLALHNGDVARFVRQAPLALRLLVLATIALPLVQLVPLPPPIWQALPGRDAVLASHLVAGWGNGQWFPLSLDRARTLVSASGLIAPLAIIVLGTMLPTRDKILLAWTVVGLALAAMLWGVVQLQAANSFGLLYPVSPKPDVLYATFANRNSTGLFLVLATTIALALALPGRPRTLLACGTIAVLLMLGAILTQSRSSMLLLAVPLVFLLLRLASHALRHRRELARNATLRGAAVALAGVLLAGTVAYTASQEGRVASSLARFDESAADRLEMWDDGVYAAGQYWPVGSGAGTFDEVFQAHESLEYVSARRAGRAHNDWIELGLEAGIFGLALAMCWLAWCGVLALRQLAQGPYWLGVGAGMAVSAIAVQSAVDYPLRNQTMLCIAAILVVLLVIRRQEPAA